VTDIVVFLAERLAEKWSAARDQELPGGLGTSPGTREADAMRRITEMYASTLALAEHPPVMAEGHPYAGKISASGYLDAKRELAVLRVVLEAIATIYSGHPDYDEDWKP